MDDFAEGLVGRVIYGLADLFAGYDGRILAVSSRPLNTFNSIIGPHRLSYSLREQLTLYLNSSDAFSMRFEGIPQKMVMYSLMMLASQEEPPRMTTKKLRQEFEDLSMNTRLQLTDFWYDLSPQASLPLAGSLFLQHRSSMWLARLSLQKAGTWAMVW